MPTKKQNRRAFSVSGTLYNAVRAKAPQEGETATGLVERVMREYLGLPPKDVPKVVTKPVEDEKPKIEEDVKPLFSPESGFPKSVYSARF